MNTPKQYIDLISSGLSNKTGVKIISGKNWKVNVSKKTLEYNSDDLTAFPFYVIRGLLLHEIGHINYTSETPDSALAQKYSGAMQQCYNCLEDKRIEASLIQEFDTFAGDAIQNLNSFFINYNLTYHSGDFIKLQKLEQFLQLLNMYSEAVVNNLVTNKIGYSIFIGDKLSNYFDADVMKRLQNNNRALSDIVHSTRYASSTQELKNIVDSDLYPIIEDYIKDYKQEGSGASQSGTPQIDKNKQMDEMKNKPTSINQVTKDTNIVLRDIADEIEARMLLYPYASTLAYRLNAILEARKTIKYSGSYQRGKLINKNVFKVLTDNKRIFSKKYNPDLPDRYRFYVGIDGSGSMGHSSKARNAILGAYLLKFTIEKMGLPIKFYEFVETDYTWELDKLEKYQISGGGTQDDKMLELINADIEKNDDGFQNVIFTITDGAFYYSDERETLFNKLKNNPLNIVLGIGIGNGIKDKELTQSYPQNILIPNVESLPMELVKILQQLIKN